MGFVYPIECFSFSGGKNPAKRQKNLCLTGDIAPLVFPRRVRQVLCES